MELSKFWSHSISCKDCVDDFLKQMRPCRMVIVTGSSIGISLHTLRVVQFFTWVEPPFTDFWSFKYVPYGLTVQLNELRKLKTYYFQVLVDEGLCVYMAIAQFSLSPTAFIVLPSSALASSSPPPLHSSQTTAATSSWRPGGDRLLA